MGTNHFNTARNLWMTCNFAVIREVGDRENVDTKIADI